LRVGLINGVVIAFLIGMSSYFIFDDARLGIVVALAMIINLLAAASSGAFLPLILKKMGIDPALAGGMMLTTITDVTGFFALLGLAAYFYA